MASARWSKGSADRHGVDDPSPRLGHVIADILSLVLMRRGSRSENVTVNKEGFVPVKALLQLVEAFFPSTFKTKSSAQKKLTEAGKLVFGSDFAVSKHSNGYYRTSAGTSDKHVF